ncbi:MAG: Wzz/FepE/Etk N-terminal domain-containing protein, partial [Terriglobia bacterium]
MTATTNYTAVSRRALDLEDYIDVARRHAVWIAGPTFLGLIVSICVAFLQPNVYESSAMMQIAPAQISDELVKTTVNQVLYDRIQQLNGAITSRTTLSAIIQDPHLLLYPSERASKPIEDVIEIMRRAVKITINNNDP